MVKGEYLQGLAEGLAAEWGRAVRPVPALALRFRPFQGESE